MSDNIPPPLPPLRRARVVEDGGDKGLEVRSAQVDLLETEFL